MFGMVAFCCYGFFWWSFAFTLIWPAANLAVASTPAALGWYMFIWGLLSACLFAATLKKAPYMTVVLFFTVILLFWLLAIHFWSGNEGFLRVAGYEGIICGLLAIYLAFAEIINGTYGTTILWTGERNNENEI